MSALPPRPSLSQLKRQAKDLHKAVARGDDKALGLVRQHHPEFGEEDLAAFSLQDAQLVLARKYEYPSWPRLVAALKTDERAIAAHGPVPTELEQVTAAYLGDLMRRSGALPTGEVRAFELHRCTDDVPLKDHTATVELDYSPEAPATAPKSIFLQMHQYHGARHRFALLEAASTGDHPPILPACYGTDYDREQGHSTLLLQNLHTTHQRVVDYVPYGADPAPPPADGTLDAIVDTMAALHAHWWEHPALRGADYERGPWWGKDRGPSDLNARQREYAQFVAEVEWLSPADRALCDTLLPVLPDLWNRHFRSRMQRCEQITLVQSSAINFTDFFVGKNAESMRITLGSPCAHFGAFNLVDLFAKHWTSAQRKDREERLLRRYHMALQQRGVQDYTWESLWTDYRLMIVFHLFLAIKHLVRLGVNPHQYLIDRFNNLIAAYRDLEVHSLVPKAQTVQIDIYTDDDAQRLTDFYNEQVAHIPCCFTVTPEEFQRGHEDRINPWPEEDNAGKKLAGHSQRRLLVARDQGAIVGFADIGQQVAQGPGEHTCGLIRMLLYKAGADAAGQALLTAAEAYFRELGLRRSEAFTKNHYSFCQYGGAGLSNTLRHIHTLFDANGYDNAKFANDGLKMGWYTFTRPIDDVKEPTPPDADIKIALQLLSGRGELPHLEIKAFRGEELLAYTWSSSAESYCMNPESRHTLYTDEVGIVDEADRGIGWGRYFMERTLWEMKKAGYRQATLMSSLSNSRAHLLFEHVSYQVVDSNCAYCKTL